MVAFRLGARCKIGAAFAAIALCGCATGRDVAIGARAAALGGPRGDTGADLNAAAPAGGYLLVGGNALLSGVADAAEPADASSAGGVVRLAELGAGPAQSPATGLANSALGLNAISGGATGAPLVAATQPSLAHASAAALGSLAPLSQSAVLAVAGLAPIGGGLANPAVAAAIGGAGPAPSATALPIGAGVTSAPAGGGPTPAMVTTVLPVAPAAAVLTIGLPAAPTRVTPMVVLPSAAVTSLAATGPTLGGAIAR